MVAAATQIYEIVEKAKTNTKGAFSLDGRMIDAASARMADNVVNIDKLINKKSYKANKIKKPIINENNAIASVKANPKIAILNNSSFKEGFLDIPITKAPKTVPIPTPAPAKPMVAKPAPINFADCNNIII